MKLSYAEKSRRMSPFTSIVMGAGLIIALPCLAGPKTASADTPVTSTLNNGYDVQSDGLGSYQHGVNSVLSVLYSGSGDWTMDTQNGSRKINVDLTDPVPGSGATPPFSTALVSKGRLVAHGGQTTPGSIAGMVGLGTTILAPLAVSFKYGTKTYALRMNPTNHSGTDWARYTCIGVVDPGNPGTSQCNQWHVEPSGIYGTISKNIALLRDETKATPVNKGQFYLTFDFIITNP